MKIMLIADFGAVHSWRYLELIRKAGCDFVLLDSGRAAQYGKVPAKQYYRWPRAGRRLTRYIIGTSLANRLGEFLIRFQLRLLWAITRPDIAHVQWIDDRAWQIAKAGISPMVLTAWGSDLNATRDPHHDPVQLNRKAEAISAADFLIADSQDIIDIAHNLANTPIPSMLLPIGIDTRMFRPGLRMEAFNWRRTLKIPETAKVILSPRAFRQNYGHDVIVKAFARSIINNNIDAYLVFKAYDCWDRGYINRITAIASACGIIDRIRIIDELAYDQLPGYYAMGDFAVNFPMMDAFPVSFLECLACELPVLTRYLPAYDSLGVSRYLQFTNSPTEESLEEGISTMLISVQSLQQGMSEARAYISNEFDESVVAESLAVAYRRVLEVKADLNSPRVRITGL